MKMTSKTRLKDWVDEWLWILFVVLWFYVMNAAFGNPLMDHWAIRACAFLVTGILALLVYWVSRD